MPVEEFTVQQRYPDTRIEAVTDSVGGKSFPDPYHWLEGDGAEIRRWQRFQADLASAHVREWSHYDRLRNLVARFSTERVAALPRYAAGRWFRTHVPEGATQAQAIVADEPMGPGRVLFDAHAAYPVRPPFLSWISPSPDGQILALGVCFDGSENNSVRLIDVTTGQQIHDRPQQTLMDCWTGGAQWLPDSSGFFFSALTGRAIDFDLQVYLHRLGAASKTTLEDVPWTKGRDYRTVAVSHDGGFAVAVEGITNPAPVAIARLKGEICWRPFLNSIKGTVIGHVVGNRYIAVTDVGAPRGRVVAIGLDDLAAAGDPRTWTELVGESDAVLRMIVPVDNMLYLIESLDTYGRIRTFDLQGTPQGEVPLPGPGAVGEMPFQMMNLAPKGHPKKFLFSFSSLTVSPGIYSHEVGQPGIETLRAPRVRLDGVVVEDRWARSSDGEHIPYHIVRRTDVAPTSAQPALIYGYGGFNVPLAPQFPGAMAAFVASGGLFVHAHLRGGGEFGVNWREGGRLHNKQKGYDDLYAIANELVEEGRTSPQLLAVTGASNGGLMAGVAVTQRPELWAVAVLRVPILDLVGACRDAYGRMSVDMEYGIIEDARELEQMVRRSPYHLVLEGVRYPAVFIEAGATDPRCPPWHARKFAARLQRCNTGGAPVLLHVWDNAGHGWATERTVALTQNAEWLAFTCRHLGVENVPL